MKTMANQSPNPDAPAVVYLTVAPRTPTPFHGEIHEDVEDWIKKYERVARHNGWTAEQCLQNHLYFSLEGTAGHWFENHEASITSWDQLKGELRETFASHHRRERAEDLLRTRTQCPNESVTSFVEDVRTLNARVDPEATDDKKLRVLMRGLRDGFFGGLVRYPPTTVEAIVTEATNMERALQPRASYYQRHPGVVASTLLNDDIGARTRDIHDVIRDVVREELRRLVPPAQRPASLSVAGIVRDEVQSSSI